MTQDNETTRQLRKMSDGELFARELLAKQQGDSREMYLCRHYRTFEVTGERPISKSGTNDKQ